MTAAAQASRAPSRTGIHREITYPHPRAKVWRALIEPELLARWLMRPDGFAPVIGTRFVLRADGPQRGWRGFVECEVLEVEPQRRMSWSWVGDPNDPPLVVTFTLHDDPGGTRFVLDHDGFAGVGGWLLARLVLGPGWSRMLGRRLAAVLADA